MTNLAISFGKIIHAGMIRDAVRSTIQEWIGTYLAEMARLDTIPLGTTEPGSSFPDFRSYVDSLDVAKFVEEQYPACVIVVPGTAGTPQRQGTGNYRVNWSVGIGVAVTGQSKARSFRLAELYTAAVRMLILQQPSLGGFSNGVQWTGERFTDLSAQDAVRTIAAGMLQFVIAVDNVGDASQGPITPIDGGIPTGWPTVEFPEVNMSAYMIPGGLP